MCFTTSSQKSKSATQSTTTTTTTSNIDDERVAAEGGSLVAAQGGVIDLTPDEAFELVDSSVQGSLAAVENLAALALDFGGAALNEAAAAGARQQELNTEILTQLDKGEEEQQEGQIIRLAAIVTVALGSVWALSQFRKKG